MGAADSMGAVVAGAMIGPLIVGPAIPEITARTGFGEFAGETLDEALEFMKAKPLLIFLDTGVVVNVGTALGGDEGRRGPGEL